MEEANREKDIAKEREQAESLAAIKVKEHMSLMFRKACTINNGKKYFKSCIHFEEARYINYIDWNWAYEKYGTKRVWTVELPYCKLWADENDRKMEKLMDIK